MALTQAEIDWQSWNKFLDDWETESVFCKR